jgi:hypothetical protein
MIENPDEAVAPVDDLLAVASTARVIVPADATG